MASEIKVTYHKRLFMMLLVFTWTIVLSFVGFQYYREKQYRSEILNAQLQVYNRQLIGTVENSLSYEDYIASHERPFDELRISVINLSGDVLYDNTLEHSTLDNHSQRPEIAQALKDGSAYRIGRYSASDGREYFYSATRGKQVVVRTAIPYTASLRGLLKTDWSFLGILIAISIAMNIVGYFVTRRLGRHIERLNRLSAHEASLRQEQEKIKIKRQLTNNINHELKTPVASIQVCLETLLSGIDLSEEKRQELIERCYAHNERLRRLLGDVSLITRMEDGSQLISREEVDINGIISEIGAELEIMPEDERFYLHIDFNDEVVINGNLSLIASIFRNLTENALAYSGGRNIYISLAENNGDYCRILFEDDGCGVDEGQLSRLFERFYRVDKGRSRQLGGTGLGLSIVKHAVQFHGGVITVENRPTGGLRFDFTLNKN
ncbi:MAG: HAMP domain-containing histidine kinase [Bacteroidales bacterium]|nr:HAMP domain-containing histidine kinase [Bacteroidales bacterium]